MRLRLAGKGEAAPAGGKAGDLYVSVEVRPHEHFERRAEHLAMRLPVFFHRAALGGEVRIRGIDGRQLSLHVPPGSQSGARLRLAGEGMPRLGGPDGRRGDLYVELFVEVPRRLNPAQKRLLAAFAETLGDEAPSNEAHGNEAPGGKAGGNGAGGKGAGRRRGPRLRGGKRAH